jgi:hypothetical protein
MNPENIQQPNLGLASTFNAQPPMVKMVERSTSPPPSLCYGGTSQSPMNLFRSAAVLGRCNVQPPMIPAKVGLLATEDTAAPEDGRAPVQGFNAQQ